MKNNPLQYINSRQELSELLNVTDKSLIWFLYRNGINKRYITFTIPKKNGSPRVISAPANYLKTVQRKLSDILYEHYSPSLSNHGFVKDRSILSNAKAHPDSTWVLNIDLKDFFNTINYGRVLGLFSKPPLNCQPDVAIVLAQICCHENQIPQGAPSSPIVSNLICRRLDRELKYLCKRFGCRYSRYADDISISTKLKKFPKSLAQLSNDPAAYHTVSLGRELVHVIKNNGFEINAEKTRLSNFTQKLEVTGLTINEKPNTSRNFVRQIRAMLHAWEKYGLEDAEKEFNSKFRTKLSHPNITTSNFRNVVNGKLNFLRMIRGVDDPLYRKMRQKFEFLDPKFTGIRDHNLKSRLYQSTWCVMSEDQTSQGTGFWLKNIGFVTCAHVVCDGQNYHAFNIIDQNSKKYSVNIKYIDVYKDLAILEIKGAEPEFELMMSEEELNHGHEITIAGFPSYDEKKNHTIYIEHGQTTQKILESKSENIMWRINAQISSGNSGGPVINRKHKVVGIVCRGSESLSLGNTTPLFGILPIKEIKTIIK